MFLCDLQAVVLVGFVRKKSVFVDIGNKITIIIIIISVIR